MKKLRVLFALFTTTGDGDASPGGDPPVGDPPSGDSPAGDPPAGDPPGDGGDVDLSWMDKLEVPEDQREQFKDIGSDKILDMLKGPEVPEAYEFSLPEGVEADSLDKDVYQKFTDGLTEFGKKHGLSQEALNDIAGFATTFDIERSAGQGEAAVDLAKEAFAGEMKEWQTEVGATKAQEAITNADKAIGGFVTPGFLALLDATGLRNSPDVIQTFAKIGAVIGEESIPKPETPAADGDDRAAKLKNLYPSMNK